MKDGTLAEKIELADNIIKMKFGNRVKSNLCTAYLSNGVIGKVFGLSREKVRQLYLWRFVELQKIDSPIAKHSRSNRVQDRRKYFGIRFLLPSQIQNLTSQKKLKESIGLTLKERCALFENENPNSHLNPTLLSKIYKSHGIKKRLLIIKKDQNRKKIDRIQKRASEVLCEFIEFEKLGYKMIFLDESLFKWKTLDREQYCQKNNNFYVKQKQLSQSCQALLMAISIEKGVEHSMIFDRSVNIPKFKTYIIELWKASAESKICLFMDNLAVHRNKDVQSLMDTLGIAYIYGVPYSPEYMPIEFVFSMLKNIFKKIRIAKLVNNKKTSFESMIKSSIAQLEHAKIINCVKHARRLLEEAVKKLA